MTSFESNMMTFELDAFPPKTFSHTHTEVDELALNDEHSIKSEGKTNLKNVNEKKNNKLLEHQFKAAKKHEAKAHRKAKAAEKKAAKAQEEMDRMERRYADHELGENMGALVVVGVLARIGTFLLGAIDFIVQFC